MENPQPTEEEVRFAIGGNLCRCTGYSKVVQAILKAAETLRRTRVVIRRNTMPDSTVLGRNYPRVDAADKVSGRSQYASDIYLPGMLMCKVLTSPKPHARILHIDTSRAQHLPGVRAVHHRARCP